MRCPFLQHAQVTYCRGSVVRKMIVRTPESLAAERCSSPEHRGCAIYREHPAQDANGSGCPFLEETMVEYCAAAAVKKYVPRGEARLSRCTGGQHRFCDQYAKARTVAADQTLAHADGQEVCGVWTPRWLFYSANHMWLEQAEDGSCHVGVDAFLAKVLGTVERVSFTTSQGLERPTAVLTVRGMDVHVAFPRVMAVLGPNQSLRTHPEQLTADPYWLGWMFEGVDADCADLIPGEEAPAWMAQEMERLAEFVRGPAGWRGTLADGGELDTRLLERMDREERFRLFHEFFSPYASWKRQS